MIEAIIRVEQWGQELTSYRIQRESTGLLTLTEVQEAMRRLGDRVAVNERVKIVLWGPTDPIDSCAIDFRGQQNPVKSAKCVFALLLEGPLLREQREFLARLADTKNQSVVLYPKDFDSIEGLIGLTDAIADQAYENHRLDCLIQENE